MQTERLQSILRDLHARIEGLNTITFFQKDGTILAQFAASEAQEIQSSIMMAFAGLLDEVCQNLEHASGKEAIIKGKKRFLALYTSHSADLFLVIVGEHTVNFGLLNSGCRIAIKKIEELYKG